MKEVESTKYVHATACATRRYINTNAQYTISFHYNFRYTNSNHLCLYETKKKTSFPT